MGARLTERTDTAVAYIGRHTKMPGLDVAGTMKVAAQREVMAKLADYEDTGLSPEQIMELLQESLRKN